MAGNDSKGTTCVEINVVPKVKAPVKKQVKATAMKSWVRSHVHHREVTRRGREKIWEALYSTKVASNTWLVLHT